MKVGAASVRSALSSNSAIQSAGCGAAANGDQRADDIAHHVMQEGIRGQRETQQVAAALHIHRLHATHRRTGLALGSAECGEILAADQVLRGIVHARRVQRTKSPAGASMQQRRTHRMVV